MTFDLKLDPVSPVDESDRTNWVERQLETAQQMLEMRRSTRFLFAGLEGNDGAAEKTLSFINVNPNATADFNFHISAFGEFANNGNLKTIRLKYGVDTLFTKDTTTGRRWRSETIISVQPNPIAMSLIWVDAVVFNIAKFDMTESFLIERRLEITGESNTASADDITLRNFLVEETKNVPLFNPQ